MNTINYHIDSEILKNYLIDDPILDWLNLYGEKINLRLDNINNEELFNHFLKKQNKIYKDLIIEKIKQKIRFKVIPNGLRLRKKISLTIDYMSLGIPVIFNCKVYSQKHNLIGSPDIIIRSDYLKLLFQNSIYYEESKNECLFSKDWYYIILDIKNCKLHLNNKNNIINLNKQIYFYKSKNIINNICLAEMQKYKFRYCYIIGNSFNFDNLNNNSKSIGIIDILSKDKDIVAKIFSGIIWHEELKTEGNSWNIYQPTKKELYPNMNNTDDYPWHSVKIEIAKKIFEITLIWNCGLRERNLAHKRGIYSWNNCNSSDLAIESNKKAKIINNMIEINKYENQTIMNPRKIKNRENITKMKKYDIEFYVDFETTYNFLSELTPDNNNGRDNQTNSYIFMIGCLTVYKVNNDQFKQEFVNFISESLDSQQEELIINQWINYMNNIKSFYKINKPFIYHWSYAEPVVYNNCLRKYENLPNLNFIDLLTIFKDEPIIIKDAFSYSLKTISKCFYKYGLINTIWDSDNIIDGKNAMFQAWNYYNGNRNKKYILKDIEKYNYIDCKVMEEILLYLRTMM